MKTEHHALPLPALSLPIAVTGKESLFSQRFSHVLFSALLSFSVHKSFVVGKETLLPFLLLLACVGGGPKSLVRRKKCSKTIILFKFMQHVQFLVFVSCVL